MGRFISADSLIPSPANPQSLNRYSYVYNNPINATDPSGHCIFGIDTILCAIALGAAIGAAADYGYQVYQNHQQGMELGAALTTDIDLLEIAAVGGGSAVGAGIGWVATPFLFGVGSATAGVTSAVCVDGDCTNEANTVADSAKEFTNVCEGSCNDATQSIIKIASETLRFTQKTASAQFSSEGIFNGETIGSLSEKIRAGETSVSTVPINYIQRQGYALIDNTRSSLALMRANIPVNQWNFVDQTQNALTQAKIDARLFANGLNDLGTEVIRITGVGASGSNLR